MSRRPTTRRTTPTAPLGDLRRRCLLVLVVPGNQAAGGEAAAPTIACNQHGREHDFPHPREIRPNGRLPSHRCPSSESRPSAHMLDGAAVFGQAPPPWSGACADFDRLLELLRGPLPVRSRSETVVPFVLAVLYLPDDRVANTCRLCHPSPYAVIPAPVGAKLSPALFWRVSGGYRPCLPPIGTGDFDRVPGSVASD